MTRVLNVQFCSEEDYHITDDKGKPIDQSTIPRNVTKLIKSHFRNFYRLEVKSTTTLFYPSTEDKKYEVRINYDEATRSAYICDWLTSKADEYDDKGCKNTSAAILEYVKNREKYISDDSKKGKIMIIRESGVRTVSSEEYDNDESLSLGMNTCRINIGDEVSYGSTVYSKFCVVRGFEVEHAQVGNNDGIRLLADVSIKGASKTAEATEIVGAIIDTGAHTSMFNILYLHRRSSDFPVASKSTKMVPCGGSNIECTIVKKLTINFAGKKIELKNVEFGSLGEETIDGVQRDISALIGMDILSHVHLSVTGESMVVTSTKEQR